MTFIFSAVRSSYRGCEKMFVIPKLRMNFKPLWQTVSLGQRSRESKFCILRMINASGSSWSSDLHVSRQISYAVMSIADETFC